MVTLLRVLPIALPLAEIFVLIAVADQIGIGWTLLALLGSAVAGIVVIRVLGAASLAQLREALARREPPAGPLFRGACVLIAGMLLIVPGFISDVFALLLLIPPTRAVLVGAVWRGAGGRGARREDGPPVIDGDYHEVRPDDAPPPRLDDRARDDARPRD